MKCTRRITPQSAAQMIAQLFSRRDELTIGDMRTMAGLTEAQARAGARRLLGLKLIEKSATGDMIYIYRASRAA